MSPQASEQTAWENRAHSRGMWMKHRRIWIVVASLTLVLTLLSVGTFAQNLTITTQPIVGKEAVDEEVALADQLHELIEIVKEHETAIVALETRVANLERELN